MNMSYGIAGPGGYQSMTEEEYRQYMIEQHRKMLASQPNLYAQQHLAQQAMNLQNYGTYSGVPINGGHRQTGAQAHNHPFNQSNLGSKQFASQAQLAQLAHQHAAAQAQLAQFASLAGTICTYVPEPAEPLEDAGISAGEIIAPRVWRYIPASGLLQSMAVDKIWALDEPMQGDPNDSWKPGVHAFKSQSEALSQYRGDNRPIVVGTVMLWGTVIEHEKGYRAEFGKVNSLDFITNMAWWKERRALQRLRARYGV